jgi:hypothetical protein
MLALDAAAIESIQVEFEAHYNEEKHLFEE